MALAGRRAASSDQRGIVTFADNAHMLYTVLAGLVWYNRAMVWARHGMRIWAIAQGELSRP